MGKWSGGEVREGAIRVREGRPVLQLAEHALPEEDLGMTHCVVVARHSDGLKDAGGGL